MLSYEEKKAIEYLKIHIIPCYGRKGTIEFMLNDIVLNIIEKQSKEIEELKRQIPQDKIFYYSEKDYTSNDKIKAKIEPKLKELNKQINEEWKKYGNSKELQDMEDMYNFLQSLLEKE